MRPSPLQLARAEFLHVSIVPRVEPDIWNFAFKPELHDFDKTKIVTSLSHAVADSEEGAQTTEFLVKLGVELPDDGENRPPYLVNIQCVGYFSIHHKAFPEETKRIDAGVVNGASILYGMIREMVSNITARSWYGPMLLPSGNFLDYKPSLNPPDEQENAGSKSRE